MDGSALEHSDSDSGESWTLLDNTPSYADEAPVFSPNTPKIGDTAENTDRDEDTDGISIISDSDPESATPYDMSYDKCVLEEDRPTETQIPEHVLVNPLPPNNNDDEHETTRSDEGFLGQDKCKLKTYVHRRNKRLSTVLNIIVLGSVITAAGVAIGHMWGARHECSSHTHTPSVNKILSNLYKLQEENAYLRNKLKELTFVNNIQMQQRKLDPHKISFKQQRCKKVFEESLNNRNAEKLTKCVDNESNAEKILENHLVDSEYEKEFLNDIDKLKNVYQQNKSWLDDEITRRIRREEQYIKKMQNNLKSPKSIKVNEQRKTLDEGSKIWLDITREYPVKKESVINVTEPVQSELPLVADTANPDDSSEKKLTYADSVKAVHKVKKRETNNVSSERRVKDRIKKKKSQKENLITENSVSDEDEFEKDDRYNTLKFKSEKKNDRHRTHKKQKRRNKYEQWEMKGGYMKDYDELSETSSQNQNDEFVTKRNPYKNLDSIETDDNKNINSNEADVDYRAKSTSRTKRDKGKGNKDEDKKGWYEKRAALRKEARKKLEHELFGESTPNTAAWYFRRMQRREQCRVKGDNGTYKRLSKRAMNFKTKH